MKVKCLAVAAPGTASAATVHGYRATVHDELVKLSHLKTVSACAGYARSKFPDNEPSDVSSGHAREPGLDLPPGGARSCAGDGHRCVPDGWRGPGWLVETIAVGSPKSAGGRWPAHLPVGALRVVRWSGRYDQTVAFYRDMIGLPVLESFQDSYGLDGTILGLPGGAVHLEIVRLRDGQDPAPGLDQLVFYLPDAAVQERIIARLAAAGVEPVAQIDYWQANGGVTYRDPDGREVVFASWIYRPLA